MFSRVCCLFYLSLRREISLPTIFYCILELCHMFSLSFELSLLNSGADPEFQVRGGGGGRAHLIKLRRAEGGAKSFGVFRVKNHHLRQKIIFFPILGPPPLDPPLQFSSNY